MDTQATYDKFSESAAENYERWFVPIIPAPLAGTLLEAASLRPGERVLDVACGTGIVARLAAEQVGPTGAVTGVDLAPDMLAVARSLSQASGTSIDWREGTAEELPIDDTSFDVALSQLAFMFLADQGAAASELHRVLVPGGRVAILVPGAIHPLNEIFAEALARHIAPDLAGFVHAVFSLHDPSVLEKLLANAGFTDVQAWATDSTLRLPGPAEYLWEYINATPMAGFVNPAPAAAREALEREIVERWQPFVEGDGMVYDQQIVLATARA